MMPSIPSNRIRPLVRKLWPGVVLVLALCVPLASQQPGAPDAKYPSFQPPPNPDDISPRLSDRYMPVIGVWNWSTGTLAPGGFENPITQAALHSPFNLLVAFLRFPDRELVDADVHDQVKRAAEYAIASGITLVADLDVRAARRAFQRRYPDQLQQMVRIKEVRLSDTESVEVSIPSLDLNDHYSGGPIPHHMPLSGSLLRVTSYRTGPTGIEAASMVNITQACTLVSASKDAVTVMLPTTDSTKRRGNTHASIVVVFTHLYPDVFSPRLPEFQRSLLQQYSDARLAGVCKDEWGFPPYYPRFSRQGMVDFWYSQNLLRAYGRHTRGRRLDDDLLLMAHGIAGREHERQMAINHFTEMVRQRNVTLEDDYYHAVKSSFGPQAAVTVHSTWWPYPEESEFKKNGLDWWAATRDWAQTDEVAPFAVRTALSKKWRSPVWYNMYYKRDLAAQMWSSVLGGGRIDYLPFQALSTPGLLQAESRIRLLNYITQTPLDCPVAVVFGHAGAMNWAGPHYNDVGMELADRLWREGYPTDLIPTSEVENGSLRIDEQGRVSYGDQRYAAVVLYHPEFERTGVARLFERAGRGSTALFRVGQWTRDFDGRPVNGKRLLPRAMRDSGDVETLLAGVRLALERQRIVRQTPATMVLDNTFFGLRDFEAKSYAPPTTGWSRLLDGTVIHVAGTANIAGDPIVTNMRVRDWTVSIDAVGVAAVRLGDKGQLEALAAGGLKWIKAGDFELSLDERVDVALWRDGKGEWQGVLQGDSSVVPEPLARLARRWTRIRVPVPVG